MDLLKGYDFHKKPPSWIFHPFRRHKFNKLLKDISIANEVLNLYCNDDDKIDKLAILSSYNDKDLEFIITYCINGTGDMVRHRRSYVFDGNNNLSDVNNEMNFVDTVIHHYKT